MVAQQVACNPDAIAIDDLLFTLGYSTRAAQRMARGALEAAGLTNPRKINIHVDKQQQARDLLKSRLFRTCGSPECAPRPQALRDRVIVAPSDCEVCFGRGTNRALRSLFDALTDRGIKRMLVVGGGPGTHEELRRAFLDSGVRLNLIDGGRSPSRDRYRALAANADVVVIWASTILPHTVSNLCKNATLNSKTVTVSRRGLQAFVTDVVDHVRQKGARLGAD